MIPGLEIVHVSDECCGMSGAYGYEKKNYRLSKEIAEKVYAELEEFPSDLIATDCGGCKLQLESGTHTRVVHPVLIMLQAYGLTQELMPPFPVASA